MLLFPLSTGKERDQESGLDYFGARYYGSALGTSGWIWKSGKSWSPEPWCIALTQGLDDASQLSGEAGGGDENRATFEQGSVWRVVRTAERQKTWLELLHCGDCPVGNPGNSALEI